MKLIHILFPFLIIISPVIPQVKEASFIGFKEYLTFTEKAIKYKRDTDFLGEDLCSKYNHTMGIKNNNPIECVLSYDDGNHYKLGKLQFDISSQSAFISFTYRVDPLFSVPEDNVKEVNYTFYLNLYKKYVNQCLNIPSLYCQLDEKNTKDGLGINFFYDSYIKVKGHVAPRCFSVSIHPPAVPLIHIPERKQPLKDFSDQIVNIELKKEGLVSKDYFILFKFENDISYEAKINSKEEQCFYELYFEILFEYLFKSVNPKTTRRKLKK
jgi:hypothetical protein